MNQSSFSKETKDALRTLAIKKKCCRTSYERGLTCFEHSKDSGGLLFDEKCEGCRAAFLRGAFISYGTVASPDRAYHLEFSAPDEACADSLSGVLSDAGYPPKKVYRENRGAYGLYYKDSDAIGYLLAYIGAHKASFELMDQKIYKDLRNNANRHANCDTANIVKTVTASTKQLDMIYNIIDSGMAEGLPEDLKETLDLRAANPDITLEQLAALHTPPLTKSGVYHRLKRIRAYAEKLKKN
ncbi:MAG: DNA-binding protein WhiA [Firmicutes bacterium]|nr:DNA-binding protein WhiA [Bacillota bacterium]